MSSSKNEELAAILHELAGVGIHSPIVAPGGKHLQVRWETNAGSRFYSLPRTGSDWRGARNARAEVRRMLRADGLLIEEKSEPSAERARPHWRLEIERLERRIARLEALVKTNGSEA